MKIVKIEGENLACFARLCVDFDKGPLADASLFAITGRTGAGKSTLLDAVCLALYGKLPRVERHAGSDLGGGYHTGKAASIIRRGQSGGYAACEFVGNDGARYRSEWRVKAGKRGARKDQLGDPELVLRRADGLGSDVRTKAEHLEAIERFVGLGEVEFRRAALLAQNDFACFLVAKLEDRAQQLARITNTEQYGAIGKTVFDMAGAYERALEKWQLKAGEHRPWTPEDEATACAEADALTEEHRAARDALKLAEKAAAEWDRHQAVARRVAAAERAVSAAEVERERSGADRQRLGWAESAERHAEAHRAARDAELGAQAAARAVTERSARVAAALAARDVAERGAGVAAAACDELQRALPAADVAAARELDGRLALARQAERHAREGAEAARADVDRRTAAVLGDTTARRAHADRLRAHRDVLADAQAVLPLLDDGEAVGLVRAAADALAAAGSRAVEWERAASQRRAAEAACAAARSTLAVRAGEREAAARARALLGAAVDLDAPRARVDAARGLRERRAALLGCGAALDRAIAQHAPQQAALQALEHELAGQHARVDAARLRATEAEHDVKGAEKLLDRVRAMASLDARRAELVDGDPCPLCGSPAHPFADPAQVPPVSPHEEQVRILRAEARAWAAEATRTEATTDAMRARQADLRAQLAGLDVELATCRERLLAAEAACPAPERGPIELIDQELAAASAALDEHVALGKAQASGDVACRLTERSEGDARAALEPLELALAAVAQREHGALAERDAADERAARARAGVGAKFAAWPDVSASLGADSAKRVDERLGTLRRARAAEREEAAAVEKLDAMVHGAEVALEAARGTLVAATVLQAERSAAVAELATARQRYLRGRETDVVVAEHEAASRAADAALKLARERQAGAVASLAAAEEEHTLAVALLASRQAAADVAGRDWAWALTLLGWSAEQFDVRTLSPGDAQALRERLVAVDRACVAADAERRAAAEERDAIGIPSVSEPESVAAEVARTSGRVDQASERLADARARHGAGRAAGAKHQELAAEIAVAQAELKPWQQLSDVIGDSVGKKFRNLAQGRTMGVLVELANERLQHFAPRYRLSQLKDPLDLAITDSDAGGEQRGTASLSGGETFLVSLALALGLGRLTANTLKLGTMFIDEGFGALDSDRVEEVLAALQTIAGSGIQIGLISHVPAVAERVGARVEVVKRGATSTIDVR